MAPGEFVLALEEVDAYPIESAHQNKLLFQSLSLVEYRES